MSFRLSLARLLARLPGSMKNRLLAKVGGRLLRSMPQDDPRLATLHTNLGTGPGSPFRFPAGFASREHWFDQGLNHRGDAGALRLFDALAPHYQGLLDVGAHLGVYALVLARRHRHWRCHAFEPTPLLAQALAANVEAAGLLERVQVHASAVSDQDGTQSFHVVPGDGQSSSLVDTGGGGATLTVPTVRLDSFVVARNIDPARWLLKVDVETAEPLVIAGAGNVLGQAPAVVMEMLEPSRRAGLVEAVATRFGYDVYYIAGRELRGKSGDDGDYVHGEYNWLFTRIRPEQLAERVHRHGVHLVHR
jgi:FkbM family methyltransferase